MSNYFTSWRAFLSLVLQCITQLYLLSHRFFRFSFLSFFNLVLVTLYTLVFLFKMLLKNILKILSVKLLTITNYISFFRCFLKPYSTSACSVYLQDVLALELVKILTGCSILSSRVLLTVMKNEKNGCCIKKQLESSKTATITIEKHIINDEYK